MKPFINITANSLPEAYEELLLEIYEANYWSKKESYVPGKEYDRILECSSNVLILNLLEEPMISGVLPLPIWKNFPTYIRDILLGEKDYLVGRGIYTYTYHDRIFNRIGGPGGQLLYVIQKLGEAPYSNRVQITTWIPEVDSKIAAPPCLQRIWFKIDDDKNFYVESDWRSRDLYCAWYENVMGIAAIGLLVIECLNDYFHMNLPRSIIYRDSCNSLHVYEQKYNEFKKDVETLKNRRPKRFSTTDPYVKAKAGDIFSAVYEAKRLYFDPTFKQ